MRLFLAGNPSGPVHNSCMSNTLTLSRTSPPLQIRLAISKNESKDYVLLVTKQGRLLLNKKVEPAIKQ
jgi:hypothetical protein